VSSLTETASHAVEKLAYTREELKSVIPVSNVTLWRLEKRNLLVRVPGIRTPIYSRASVERFLAGKAAA
jgi:hypothetical protein